MRLICCLLLLSFSTSFADTGLDKLKQSFSDLIQFANKKFDRAAVLEPIMLVRGAELTKEACADLQSKIRANYIIDPFEVFHEGGSTFDFMCGGRYGIRKNFIQNVSGKSNFGLDYAFVIQLEGQNYWREVTSHYFIDSHYRIVEIQRLSIYPKTGELLEYAISSVDSGGDVYFSDFAKNFSIVNKNIEGTQTIEKFISTDGSLPFPIVRNTITHKTDSNQDYQVLQMARADKKDWEDFQLPITHAWQGGFYSYTGKQYRTNKYYSYLTIKYRGRKEYCASGSIKEDQKWFHFPLDSKAYYECLNY